MPPHDYLRPSAGSRAWALGRFVLSAAAVSLALHIALREPWLGAALGVLLLGFGVPQLRARQRLRQLLSSGDLRAILEVWNEAIDTLPHHRTIGPLIRATALAAHGLTDRARGVMDRAERGLAWENAIEHRLFLETLLDAFEGRRTQALDKARAADSRGLCAVPFDVLGDPFAPVRIDPAWLEADGGRVRQVAAGIEAEGCYDEMAVLGDVLQDAGCADARLLEHCSQARHWRGCWLIDALLGCTT